MTPVSGLGSQRGQQSVTETRDTEEEKQVRGQGVRGYPAEMISVWGTFFLRHL